jgi:cobalt-zinc-cadmium efflux system protein
MSHHHHQENQPASLANLILAIIINGGIVVFEMIFGLLISSMALISDAVHNLSDIAAMSFTYWAEKMSRRPATEHKTYGWRKMEFIAAFVNSIVLSVVIAFVFWESVQRLFSPAEVSGKIMLWVAVVAFVGNGVATLLLQKISSRNFNIKSAWLHSLQDALFSLGVIVGALLIMFFDLYFVDPLISIVICIFIAREIYKIIRHTINALLDAVPADVDFNAVKSDLLSVSGVAEVNDLHIWQTGTGQKLLSAHLLSDNESPDHEQIIRAVQEILHETHGINHTTIQLLPSSAREMEHCNHCN